MAYDPRPVQGSLLKYSTSAGGTYTLIPGVRGPKQTGAQATEIEYTAVSDTVKKKAVGLKDSGSFTFTLFYDPQDTVHLAMLAAYDAGTKWYFRYTFAAAAAKRAAFAGQIKTFNYGGEVDNMHTREVEVTIDGAWTEEADS